MHNLVHNVPIFRIPCSTLRLGAHLRQCFICQLPRVSCFPQHLLPSGFPGWPATRPPTSRVKTEWNSCFPHLDFSKFSTFLWSKSLSLSLSLFVVVVSRDEMPLLAPLVHAGGVQPRLPRVQHARMEGKHGGQNAQIERKAIFYPRNPSGCGPSRHAWANACAPPSGFRTLDVTHVPEEWRHLTSRSAALWRKKKCITVNSRHPTPRDDAAPWLRFQQGPNKRLLS